ncbi:MAG: cation:proton antiporter subunit C [Oscillospiraceae bacterium]|nr:cation:proton antiporter subunit C [Oscillospiraceae bacterium]
MSLSFNTFVRFAPILLFFIGFYGLLISKTIIKSIIACSLMETAIILFFLTIGYTDGAMPPIYPLAETAADPLPQALMITAIIIGISVTAVNLIIAIALYRKFGTSDWTALKGLVDTSDK